MKIALVAAAVVETRRNAAETEGARGDAIEKVVAAKRATSRCLPKRRLTQRRKNRREPLRGSWVRWVTS